MGKAVILALFVVFSLAAVSASPQRRQIGICVQECSLTLNALGAGKCPSGTVCKSNGCGHTCQPDTAVKPNPSCPGVLCAMFCENGFQVDKNGCPMCRCNQSHDVLIQ